MGLKRKTNLTLDKRHTVKTVSPLVVAGAVLKHSEVRKSVGLIGILPNDGISGNVINTLKTLQYITNDLDFLRSQLSGEGEANDGKSQAPSPNTLASNTREMDLLAASCLNKLQSVINTLGYEIQKGKEESDDN